MPRMQLRNNQNLSLFSPPPKGTREQHQGLSKIKSALTNLKTSIPIKQYSNHFFRQAHSRHKGAALGEGSQYCQQRRFNTLIKKQMTSKLPMKQKNKEEETKCSEHRASMITITGYCKKEKKRSVTEV